MDTIAKIRPGITERSVIPFLALVFGLSWSTGALLMLFGDRLVTVFGELGPSNPLVLLIIYSPAFAGIFLVWRDEGMRGLFRFFRRLTLWRAPLAWWLFVLLGIPAIVFTGAALKGTFGDPFPFSRWYEALPALALALFLGPIEEFGWRGVALPLLQRRLAPFWAGLLLGAIWAVWHLPAFLSSGMPQSGWSVGPYLAGIVAVSVILTPLFNAARGSLLIAFLFHFQIMNPLFPDAQPWDNLLYVAVAALIVWLNRRTLFRRGAGVTEVLAPSTTGVR